MENRSVAINCVLAEIDIIIQKQVMIVNYNMELEDRRIRLMEFIQTSVDLNLSERDRENLIVNVSNMKMEVVGTGKEFKKTVKVEEWKRCRYNNKGYCRYQNECKFRHFEKVCEKFLKDGKCDLEQNCQSRHPQTCKFWKGDSKGCKRK